LSRKACYRLALLLGSLAAMLDRPGWRLALSNLRVALGDEISSEHQNLRLAEARVSILLYDALDFSTDRDDGGGQTRESLSRIASSSTAVAALDPARFAHQVRRSRQVLLLLTLSNTTSERIITKRGVRFGPRCEPHGR
jgi:hypothetical protein